MAKAEGEGLDILRHLETWASSPGGPRMTVLLGDFGMGKTVTCQMLTQRLLANRREKPGSAPLPIYLDMREIREAKAAGDAELKTLLADMLRPYGEGSLDPGEVIHYAQKNGALVIFDGLDEVTNKLSLADGQRLFRAILRIVPEEDWEADRAAREANRKRGRPSAAAARRGPRLLVSCRTHYFADVAAQRGFLTDKDRAGLDVNDDVAVWFMLPFNASQIESYLKQNLGEADGGRALAMIAQTYNLGDLAARPILLRFFSETFRALEQAKLKGKPIDIGAVYEAFVDQTLARDEGKHVIPLLEKKWLLAELALRMHAEGVNEIDNDALDVWLTGQIEAEPALRKLRWGAERENPRARFALFLQDLRSATLLVRPGQKAFAFGHTSVREYFLAEALHRRVREGRFEALDGTWVSPETMDFLAARQRSGAPPRDAAKFLENWPRLLAAGRPAAARAFAAWATWGARGAWPWPEVADLSRLDFSNREFAAAGRGAEDAVVPPPRANLSGARLHGARFIGLDARGYDLTGADASGSFWVDCDFSGARAEGLDLQGAEVRRCRADVPAVSGVSWESARVVQGEGCLAALNIQMYNVKCDAPVGRVSGSRQALATLTLDGQAVIVSGSDDNTVRIWDLKSGQPLRVLEGHTNTVTSLAALKLDGRDVVASGSWDNTVRVWDPQSGQPIRVLEGHTSPVSSLAALELDGRDLIASGSWDNTVRVWDPQSGQFLRVLEGHTSPVTSLASFKLDGRDVIASGSDDSTVRVWDPKSDQPLRVLEGHTSPVTSLGALKIDGRDVIASGSYDNTVRIWDPQSGQPLRVLEGHTSPVTSLAALKIDGRDLIASGSHDNTVRIWDPKSGQFLRVLEGHTSPVTSLASFKLDGRDVIASGSDDSTVRIWDPKSGQPLRVIEGHTSPFTSLAALKLDGRDVIASGSYDNTVRIWDPKSGQPLRVLEGHTDWVTSLAALKLDGRDLIASGSHDNTVRIWDPKSGQSLRVFEGHKRRVASLAVLKLDGRDVIASGSHDNTVRIWDPKSGQPLGVLERHTGWVTSLAAFKLDGRDVIASGSHDKTVRIWDPQSGQPLRVLEGRTSPITSLAVLKLDGRDVIASGSYDNTVRLWDTRDGAALATLDPRVGGAARATRSSNGGLWVYGNHAVLTIDSASLAALVSRRGVVTERRLAPRAGYAGAFVETRRDAGSGELIGAEIGPEAWRDFLAIGHDEKGIQRIAPIEAMATR
jgi:WD40 repeat protein